MAFSSQHSIPPRKPIVPRPSAEGEVQAARHLFGRWPLVPSRELKRIRQVLLHAAEVVGAESTNGLSASAQELLHLVTEELQRRDQQGRPFRSPERHSRQAARTHAGLKTEGVPGHGRAL